MTPEELSKAAYDLNFAHAKAVDKIRCLKGGLQMAYELGRQSVIQEMQKPKTMEDHFRDVFGEVFGVKRDGNQS